MRGRAVLAAILIVIAIGCVPGRLGVVDVGAILPPMPLKTTPETLEDAPAPRPTFTETPPATPTPTPTPTPASPATGGPEYLPSEPDPP
jgi:hypothetical protein